MHYVYRIFQLAYENDWTTFFFLLTLGIVFSGGLIRLSFNKKG